jgi:hypothetical protein
MSNTDLPEHVLIVGRSPSVLVEAVDKLRARGYSADATNQFDQVLDDYDVTNLDVLVFGGMVPPDTKQHLREEITARNPRVTFVQGLAGIAGVIAAQVESIDSPDTTGDIVYDAESRAVRLDLDVPAHVTVEAWWGTSFTPPEPTSTSTVVWDGQLDAGRHIIALPEEVPDVASFAAVSVGSTVRVFTIGAMPTNVMRMVPKSADDKRLPEVAQVTTRADER